MWETIKKNPISAFAVVCVAAIGIFLGYMAVWLTNTLSSSAWCANALQAERISPGNTFVGLTSCVELLKIQLQATADNSKIVFGAYAFSLLVLIVVVVAGARASGKIPGGLELDIGRDQPAVPVKVTNPPADPVPVTPQSDPSKEEALKP